MFKRWLFRRLFWRVCDNRRG